jgi:CheY-like chemotaxis protein
LRSVNVEGVLREVLELTRARWSDMPQQRGVVIHTRVVNKEPGVRAMAVESELRGALVNLVLNSIDAMPEGGTLTLQTGISDAGVTGSGRVYIEVIDSGIGMDEETRRRCLEPFFTTKGDRGSGLGLAMVYGIAQRHDMEIDITSSRGAGTTFRLTFPARPAHVSHAEVPAAEKRARRSRLLLIDDDPVLLASLRDMLVHEGHEVEIAGGGKQGVDAFLSGLETGRPFTAVITDLGMPHLDGRAVAAAISKAAPGTPVVLLTGWGQRLSAAGESPPDVMAVLDKPPKLAELRRTLADCIGEHADDIG